MTAESGPPLLFDPRRRAAARDRAHARFAEHDFLHRHMLDSLFERLGDVKRSFSNALVIGCPDNRALALCMEKGMDVTCVDPGARNAAAVGGIRTEEDALPFAPDSFDLVLACGTLDTVNDLPGALILIRQILRPDGLFLGACLGAGSLPRLRQALLSAEGDSPRPHIHPQTDVRAMGDLLARAGFAMPVADSETLTVRYSSMLRLMHDLRYMGAGNVMAAGRRGPLTRDTVLHAAALFTDAADRDGKTAETFSILHMSGWKPDASQPVPARRGSATVLLSQALKSRA